MLRGSLGRKKLKICIAALWVLLILVICQFGYFLIQKRSLGDELFNEEQLKLTKKDFKGKPLKTVHLDLKGAPPLLNYLRKILPILAAAGCDSLLIEYEDMFPYNGKLANLSAGNSYTRQQIKTLLSWAHDLNMEVIPLVQTFGHVEFALKLEEWQHLREVATSPQELCPSKDGTMEFIEEMLRQVMLVHKGIRYLHIGADEVFHMGVCSQCIAREMTSRELYIDHVTKVAEHIHSIYPGVTPIIWDDMIRSSPHLLSSTKLPELVEPMIWCYSTNVPQQISAHIMYWYSKVFPRIWIAGAFKGANQPTQLLPNLELRLLNQISWMKFLKKYNKTKIVGYVLTGWSRFDHFAVLCELLPSALPSLLLNLHFIQLTFSNQTINEEILYNRWLLSIFCPDKIHFTPFTINKQPEIILSCQFPGVELYEAILNLTELRNKIKILDDTLTKSKGWLTRYNIKHNYTNTWYVKDYRNYYIQNALRDLDAFKVYIESILSNYFDQYIIKEWCEQNIEPLIEKLYSLDEAAVKLLYRRVWQRRPLD